ncbi:hypothetical protein HZB06_03280 [Candidatus Wolfebacteria bacterium]|nr:hypothetical protein [Candidatus Wolfebacteria bacterium]
MKIKFYSGQMALQVLIYGGLSVILMAGFLMWADTNINAGVRYSNRALALSIAESGIEYYRWHLAHASEDYQDGTGQPGPYTHNFYDKSGNKIGEFILDITEPLIGSTVVTVKSTGKIVSDATIEKIIEVKMGIPSLAKYAAVLNDNVRFGSGTIVSGEIHSNKGVRFDGLAYNLVTSALSSYDDPDHTGANEFGVHTHVSPTDPLPPASVPARTDVFIVGRQFPVPEVDFVGIIQTLSQIKDNASSSGFYRGSSGAFGYEVILKTNDTFDLYRINTLVARPSQCTDYSSSQDGWGTWSIQATSSIGNYSLPTNGLIFLEDNVWVSGQINTARVTIASARFPDNLSTRSSITVNNDLLYSNYDSQDVISLIAQKNINIGLRSENDLRIDAALIAQNGRVGRYYYVSGCGSYYIRSVITSYGMIASSQRYGFAYTNGTGYQTRNLTYDANLLYNPPPSFPLTSDSYKVLLWKEIK